MLHLIVRPTKWAVLKSSYTHTLTRPQYRNIVPSWYVVGGPSNSIAWNNPNLYCIEVDDSTWSAQHWMTQIDPQAYFSEYCNYVSVPNQLKTQKLKIAPNPFKEKLSVLLPENTNAGNIEIAFYNVLGKQIKVSTEMANNEIIINGASLKPGIYFVELTTSKQTITKRVIKQ